MPYPEALAPMEFAIRESCHQGFIERLNRKWL
jgi:hypothetical protein